MKSQIIIIVFAVLLVVNILSLSVKTNLANAAVICVDKYNYSSVIPCSDQNAIVAPASGNISTPRCQPGEVLNTLNLTYGVFCSRPSTSANMTVPGNMTANMTSTGNMTLPTTSPPAGGNPQEPVINNLVVKQNDRYYEGLNWWGVCNNPLLRSYITQPCNVLVTPDKNALTSKGKVVLEGILCPRGPSIVTTLELFYGTISQKLKNDLGLACGWH